MPKAVSPSVEDAANLLEGYAARGVFRGFSRGASTATRATFKLLWHRDRMFELTVDTRRNTLRIPVVLPAVPPGSAMYREFREFVAGRQSPELPEHRRIDRGKASLRCANRGGEISLTVTAVSGDLDYGVRKLIHLVHEIFMVFLYDGRYYDYMIEVFQLDPDRM